MPENKGGHLTFDDRCIIEEMIKEKRSFREIARTLGVSPSTVSYEVRSNRHFSMPKSRS